MNFRCLTAAFVAGLLFVPAGLSALSFWLEGEGGGVLTGYNDVQIPADTGTRFSLSEDLSAEPAWFYRLRAGAELGRHSVAVLFAPLTVTSDGTLGTVVDFYGKSFPAGTALTATYRFNSYRLTYAYTLLDGPSLSLAAGLTGKIRDAEISLEGAGQKSSRTDLGFVPLLHLRLHWRFLPAWGLLIEGDGLAAPQGRAEDFLAALTWSVDRRLALRAGYRFLEGGSEGGGSVYTFSLFHYFTAGARYTF